MPVISGFGVSWPNRWRAGETRGLVSAGRAGGVAQPDEVEKSIEQFSIVNGVPAAPPGDDMVGGVVVCGPQPEKLREGTTLESPAVSTNLP
jgi:hypothetical protein